MVTLLVSLSTFAACYLVTDDGIGFGYHADFMMGWEEDFLQQAVDTCTNQSGRIQDCPLFDIISETEARACSMKLPSELSGEDVLKSLLTLPGDVSITFKEGEDDGSSTKPEEPETSEKPDDNDGGILDPPAPTLPSAEIPEVPIPTSAPGNVFKETSVYEAPPPPATTVAAVAENTDVPPPPPTTTAAPEIVPIEDPNVSFFSTQYVTAGNVVSKIYWDQEVVWVTEVVDSTTTVTMKGPQAPAATEVVPAPEAAAPVRRHLHNHVHRHI